MSHMRTLLLQLPLSMPGPASAYGVAEFDPAADSARVHATSTPLTLLPRLPRATEVVALVPAAVLSWHRMQLPAGLGRQSARLLAALQGLLEDRLLQDLQHVHLALAPQWQAGQAAWVAACDKAWLQAHMQALQEAGLAVQRIVPEFTPADRGQRWHAVGDEGQGWLWCSDAVHGVTGWPVVAAGQLPASWLGDHALQAEPGLARWAQSRSGATVQLVDSASHWIDAVRGHWNLAQFDLQSDARTRRLQGLRRQLDTLARGPQWRPARWGLVALLLSQLVGLQAWAWMTRQQWQVQEAQWTQILQQSFPKVTVVVDAPLQMAREVARLRQGSGQLAPQDLEAQLQALGRALPSGAPAPSRLNYQDGQLQWPALSLNAAQQSGLEQALQTQGYRLSTSTGTSRLQTTEAQP